MHCTAADLPVFFCRPIFEVNKFYTITWLSSKRLMSSLPPVRGPRGNKVAPIVAAPPRLNAGDAGEAASEEDDESQ